MLADFQIPGPHFSVSGVNLFLHSSIRFWFPFLKMEVHDGLCVVGCFFFSLPFLSERKLMLCLYI